MAGRLGSALATLLAIVACVVLPVAVVSTWMRVQLVDNDHYVSAVTPLYNDPEVATAVTDEIAHLLPNAPAAVLEQVVDVVVGSPGFKAIWVRSNRVGQRQLIEILEKKPGAPVRVSLPVADLNGGLGGITLPTSTLPKTISIELVSSQDLEHAQRGYQLLDKLWIWPAIGWLALVVLALVLPGSKRRVLALLGAGSLLVSALLAGALLLGRSQLVALGSRAHGRLVADFWDALAHSLWVTVVVIAAASVLALLVSAVTGLFTRRGVFEE